MSLSLSTTGWVALVVPSLTGMLLLSACGASSPSASPAAPAGSRTSAGPAAGPAASGPHNSADLTFATDMVPHHTQAVLMADLALRTSRNPQLLALATAIRNGQGPEIGTLQGWLRGWAAPASGSGQDMSAMPHGSGMSMAPHGSAMAGMMSDQQMAALSGATGADFDQRWLTMMTAHHTGAIQRARTELADGQNPDARQLAGQIVAAQTAELGAMAGLGRTLSPPPRT